jgi:[ribosomal protein S18]-alanine N-acetyltransferase
MKIIEAGPLAAEVFAAVHEQAFAEAWSASAFHGTLLGLGAIGLIAMDGDAPCGLVVVSAAADEAEILTIGVLPAARGRGIGAALMNAALAAAAAKGAKAMFLEVAADNTAARALYARLDFAQVGLRKGYYSAGETAPRDALVLRKSIND